MNIVLLIVFAYLCGSIPSGIWIGKQFKQIDIRNYGSGNMGSTNAFRVLGKKLGSFVFIVDTLKGTLPTLLALYFTPHFHPLFVGVFAIIGHVFPIFAQFKGGKAVATTAGVLIAVSPALLCYACIAFALSLYFSRMVSLSSILASLVAMVLSLFANDTIVTTIVCLLGVFIIYRHHTNIKRILNHTENKVPFGFNYKK